MRSLWGMRTLSTISVPMKISNKGIRILGTSVSGVDLLLKTNNFSVVLIGAAIEVLGELSEFFVQVSDEVIDGVKKLLEGSLALEVDLSEIDNPSSPLRLLDLSKVCLLLLGEHVAMDVDSECGGAQGEDQDGCFHFD